MEGIKSKSNNYDFERSEKNKILKHFNEDSEIENKLLENLKNTSIKLRFIFGSFLCLKNFTTFIKYYKTSV